ncbi:MAG: 4-hydroxy-tetrahydrodipicolinate reductase [Planctomycetota bacterium]|jgi:4-hydroxy-tetrahydrodipicolinate reductase
MTHSIRLVIFGASGRNGRRLIALGHADPSVQLVGALVGSASRHHAQDAGQVAGIGPIGLPLTNQWPTPIDAVIDFSSPEGCMTALEHCAAHGVPLVIATTGLHETQIRRIEEGSRKIPICYAPNMSVAVNVAMKLAEQAARALKDLPNGADVEIIERHHRFKEDSPSGTALKFGQIIAKEMGITSHVHGRHGMVGKRPHDEIGYHAVRVGDDAGQHTIVFGMLGETVEIRVAASNRDCYASGAIAAAKYLVGKPAGMYSMANVLGLS